MTFEEQVRNAASPQEALAAVAAGIDLIIQNIQLPTPDPWGGWPKIAVSTLPPPAAGEAIDGPSGGYAVFDEQAAQADYQRRLAALGEVPTDPDERSAWEANRRLLADTLNPPTPNIGVVDSALETFALGNDRFEVTVPKADEGTKTARALLAAQIGLNQERWWSKPELALTTEQAIDYYVKGGPVWLHAYDRAFVMALPAEAKRALVEDVERYSPDDAHDLARDILKDTDPHGNKQVVIEHAAAAQGLPRDIDV